MTPKRAEATCLIRRRAARRGPSACTRPGPRHPRRCSPRRRPAGSRSSAPGGPRATAPRRSSPRRRSGGRSRGLVRPGRGRSIRVSLGVGGGGRRGRPKSTIGRTPDPLNRRGRPDTDRAPRRARPRLPVRPTTPGSRRRSSARRGGPRRRPEAGEPGVRQLVRRHVGSEGASGVRAPNLSLPDRREPDGAKPGWSSRETASDELGVELERLEQDAHRCTTRSC